jgi:hypothetical protein
MKISLVFLLATMILMSPLGTDGQSDSTAEETLLQEKDGNFVLYVSNQSFALTPVDVIIHIDGKNAISADFDVGNQHNWTKHTYRLAPGKHKLVARSRKGAARIEKVFEVKEKHWAVVAYWYNPKEGGKRHFSFHIQDKPVYFM